MTGQALLLLSYYASYMTGGEYFVDRSVYFGRIGDRVLSRFPRCQYAIIATQ